MPKCKPNSILARGRTSPSTSTVAIGLIVCLVIHCVMESARAESVLFVSPQGKDAWSGRIAVPAKDGSDGPLPRCTRRSNCPGNRPQGNRGALNSRRVNTTWIGPWTWDRTTLV